MMKFVIDYTDKNGDLCHVWTRANNKQEAEQNAYSEYWDISEIINIKADKEG